MSLSVTLTMPPSVNHIWRMGRNRMHRNEVYTKWMNAAAWTIKAEVMKNGGVINGDVRVKVAFFPRNPLRDLDNMLKGICDALVQGGAIENDNKIVELRAKWIEHGATPRARVQVESA